MIKCPNCEKDKLIEVNDIVSQIEGHFFVVKGKRCLSCGEEFVSEKEGQKMIEIARNLGRTFKIISQIKPKCKRHSC